MNLSVDFSKKSIVFLTGASRGIGQTIAIELAKRFNQHSIFILMARCQEGLDQTKKDILSVNKALKVLTFVVDLSKPDINEYGDIFTKVLSSIDTSNIEFGYIFHNAGHVGVLKPTTELTDLQTWREYFDLNLFSTVLLNSVFIQKISSIVTQLVVVNITSMIGTIAFQNMSMYGSGKASRDIFFKVLAVEQPKVMILNYAPGPVRTDMFHSVCDTAESEELRKKFRETRDTIALTREQTVGKLLGILEKGEYKSGDSIDYYNRI